MALLLIFVGRAYNGDLAALIPTNEIQHLACACCGPYRNGKKAWVGKLTRDPPQILKLGVGRIEMERKHAVGSKWKENKSSRNEEGNSPPLLQLALGTFSAHSMHKRNRDGLHVRETKRRRREKIPGASALVATVQVDSAAAAALDAHNLGALLAGTPSGKMLGKDQDYDHEQDRGEDSKCTPATGSGINGGRGVLELLPPGESKAAQPSTSFAADLLTGSTDSFGSLNDSDSFVPITGLSDGIFPSVCCCSLRGCGSCTAASVSHLAALEAVTVARWGDRSLGCSTHSHSHSRSRSNSTALATSTRAEWQERRRCRLP